MAASGIAFTPDGTEVFLTDFITGVFVIDAATQTDIPTPGTPISIVPGADVAISQDGEFAYIPFQIPAEGARRGCFKGEYHHTYPNYFYQLLLYPLFMKSSPVGLQSRQMDLGSILLGRARYLVRC